jgi:hypothetical protein
LNSCCPGSTTGRSFAVPPLTPPNSQHNSPKLFLLREALHYFFTQVLDFTYSYKTIILYISVRTHRYHPNSYSLKILPITPHCSKILMPTSLQLHCFHRPGGEGVPHRIVGFRQRTQTAIVALAADRVASVESCSVVDSCPGRAGRIRPAALDRPGSEREHPQAAGSVEREHPVVEAVPAC